MKKLSIPLAICFLLFQFTSCKKIISEIFSGIDVNAPAVQITVPAIIAVSASEISLGSFSFHFNLDSIIKANTVGVFSINSVGSVKVKQVSINIPEADQLNNLANFESVRVTLQSNTNNTPADFLSLTFPDTYASSNTSTPANPTEILSYLKGTDITYTMYGKMRRVTSKPLTIILNITLRAN